VKGSNTPPLIPDRWFYILVVIGFVIVCWALATDFKDFIFAVVGIPTFFFAAYSIINYDLFINGLRVFLQMERLEQKKKTRPVASDEAKNPYIIPALIIAAAMLVGSWMVIQSIKAEAEKTAEDRQRLHHEAQREADKRQRERESRARRDRINDYIQRNR